MARNSALASLYTPAELTAQVGGRARALRLARGLRQADLAAEAGISLATLKRFEATGQAAFESVVRIAVALRAEADIAALFPPPVQRSLDDVIGQAKPRVRAQRRPRS
jgi:transcriptional regulator with XRE-family HTH domain